MTSDKVRALLLAKKIQKDNIPKNEFNEKYLFSCKLLCENGISFDKYFLKSAAKLLCLRPFRRRMNANDA